MSTTPDDIVIDLDEIDRALAAEKAAKANKGKNPAPKDNIEVAAAEAAPKPEEKPILKPEEGIDKLKQQLAEERSAREEAEARLREASESEVRARTDSLDTQIHLVTTAIEKFEQQKQVLKANYAQALADQDYNAAADIQASMAENAADLVNLKQGKVALEKQPKPQPRAQPDIVEQFVQNMTPRSASWVRAHPDFVRDARKNAKMIAAHNFIKDDVKVDSDEYFSKIEEMLGLQATPDPETPTPEEIDPMAETAKPVRKAAPAAAPVTRSGNGAGKRTNTVTLTAEEREMARMNEQTDEEYARNKVALQKEGRLN